MKAQSQQMTQEYIVQQLPKEKSYKQWKQKPEFVNGLTLDEISDELLKYPIVHEYYKKNSQQAQWNFIQIMMKVPTPGDCPGFVYGFMDEKENNIGDVPYWIKMGMTKLKVPQNRIFQWDKTDQKQFTQIFTVRSSCHKKLQKLVHALFAYARQNRQIGGKNHVEWFRFHELTLTTVSVALLAHIMETLHEKHKYENVKTYNNRNTAKFEHSLYQINANYASFKKQYEKSFYNSLKNLKSQIALTVSNKKEDLQRIQNASSLEELKMTFRTLNIGDQVLKFLSGVEEWENNINDTLRINNEIKQRVLAEFKRKQIPSFPPIVERSKEEAKVQKEKVQKEKVQKEKVQKDKIQNTESIDNLIKEFGKIKLDEKKEEQKRQQLTPKKISSKSNNFYDKTEKKKKEETKYNFDKYLKKKNIPEFTQKKKFSLPEIIINKIEKKQEPKVQDKVQNLSENSNNEEKKLEQQKIERVTISNLSEVEDYAQRNKIEHNIINVIRGDFILDRVCFDPKYSLTVLARKIRIPEEMVIESSFKKQRNSINFLCKEIEGQSNLKVLNNAGEISIAQIFSSQVYIILDDHHRNNQISADDIFMKKMMKKCANL